MPTSPRIIVSSPHQAEETDLIPPYGAAPAVLQQTSSDEEVPTPTWDSLAAVAESDLAPTRSTHTPRPTSIGDFGFTGTFISEETVLPGSLEIKKNKITLWASGAQLASWKPSDCKVQRMEGNQFSIEADDEMVTFTADDPEGLIDAISAHLTPEAVVGTVTEPAKAPKPAKTPKHTGPNKASETEAGDPIETDPVAIWFEPTNKPDRPIAAEPTVTAEPTDRHAPSSKPSPTARADHSPPIRRPRIKAFQTRSEGSTETAKSDSSRGSNEAGNAPSSDAAPAKVVEVPVLPAETEPATIADRITDTAKRRYKSARAHRWLKSDLETFAVKAGVIGAALGLLTLFAVTIFILAGGSGGETEGLVRPSTTTIPPAPTTTVVVTTLPPQPTTLFQTDAGELTERWNALAEASRPELVLFNDLSSSFFLSLTPYMTLEGLLDPVAGSVVIRATPTGTPEGDSLILTALGLVIGMSDPTLDGSDRRLLLDTLGLSVEDPQLGGLDGAVNYNGLLYHLVYLEDQGVIEFRIAPEGSTTTTTTTLP